jgi:hypothetical protein
MKQERSGWNLAEKSGTDRDLKWDEICSVLFRFLNWYGTFRPFRTKRNVIDNLALYSSRVNMGMLLFKCTFQSCDATNLYLTNLFRLTRLTREDKNVEMMLIFQSGHAPKTVVAFNNSRQTRGQRVFTETSNK